MITTAAKAKAGTVQQFLKGVPGLYRNIPAETYHAFDACSKSRLDHIHNGTPAHCREAIDHPPLSTPAQLLGTAIHTLILEPDAFHKTYAIADQCAAIKSSDGKRCSNPGKICRIIDGEVIWYCSVKGHDIGVGERTVRQPLTHEDYDVCMGVRDSVMAHPAARKLLEYREDTELTALWIDPETKQLCKARLDAVCKSVDTLADLKSTISASPREYERSIFHWNYHHQGAMYLNGLAVLSEPLEHFVQIVFEKVRPFAVAVYRLRDDVLRAGYEQLRPLVATYAECSRTGRWPAYSPEVQDIALPKYAWSQMGLTEGVVI